MEKTNESDIKKSALYTFIQKPPPSKHKTKPKLRSVNKKKKQDEHQEEHQEYNGKEKQKKMEQKQEQKLEWNQEEKKKSTQPDEPLEVTPLMSLVKNVKEAEKDKEDQGVVQKIYGNHPKKNQVHTEQLLQKEVGIKTIVGDLSLRDTWIQHKKEDQLKGIPFKKERDKTEKIKKGNALPTIRDVEEKLIRDLRNHESTFLFAPQPVLVDNSILLPISKTNIGTALETGFGIDGQLRVEKPYVDNVNKNNDSYLDDVFVSTLPRSHPSGTWSDLFNASMQFIKNPN